MVGKGKGEGTFGEVYVAYDLTSNQLVVMKVLKESDHQKLLKDQLREYMYQHIAYSVLSGPCRAPKPHGFFCLKNDSLLRNYYCSYIMVSEYISVLPLSCASLTLDKALKEHSTGRPILTSKAWRDVSLALIEAATTLHQHDLYHNDLKANNIMLSFTEDHRIEPVILDYGLASRSSGNGDNPKYMYEDGDRESYPHIAPELYHQADPIPTSDLYSISYIILSISTYTDLPHVEEAVKYYRDLIPEERPGKEVLYPAMPQ